MKRAALDAGVGPPVPSPSQDEQFQAENNGTNILALSDAIHGIIWSKLDRESQHRLMLSCTAFARSPAILAQMSSLELDSERPWGLESFPSKASLRRLSLSMLDAGDPSYLRVALDYWVNSPACWRRLRGLQELRLNASSRASGDWMQAAHVRTFPCCLREQARSLLHPQGIPIGQGINEVGCMLACLCPTLRVLELTSDINAGFIHALSTLRDLRHLVCTVNDSSRALQDSIQSLATAAQLSQLHLEVEEPFHHQPPAHLPNNTVILDLSPFSALSKLKQLHLKTGRLQVTGMQAMARGCVSLTDLLLQTAGVQVAGEQGQGGSQQTKEQAAKLWPALAEAQLDVLVEGSLEAMVLHDASALHELKLEHAHLHMRAVSRMTSLRHLKLSGTTPEEYVLDVSCLSALAQLRTLWLSFHQSELSGMQAIATGCTRLTGLHLEVPGIKQQHHHGQQQHQWLALPGHASTSSTGASTSNSNHHRPRPWPALTNVGLVGMEGSRPALGLHHAPLLDTLILNTLDLQLEDVALLRGLRHLSLEGWPEDEENDLVDVGPLAALKQLQRLELKLDPAVTCAGVRALAQGCTSLSSLHVWCFKIAPEPEQVQAQGAEQQHTEGQQQAGQQQQGGEGQQQKGQELQWWPSLTSVVIDEDDAFQCPAEPGQVTALQLYRARRLEHLHLAAVSLKSGSPASEPGVFVEMCRQLGACPAATRPRDLKLVIDRQVREGGMIGVHGPAQSKEQQHST